MCSNNLIKKYKHIVLSLFTNNTYKPVSYVCEIPFSNNSNNISNNAEKLVIP